MIEMKTCFLDYCQQLRAEPCKAMPPTPIPLSHLRRMSWLMVLKYTKARREPGQPHPPVSLPVLVIHRGDVGGMMAIHLTVYEIAILCVLR